VSTPLAQIVPFELPKAPDPLPELELSRAFDVALDTLHDLGAYHVFRARLAAVRATPSAS
jgi:hypothetical protein